MLPSMALIIDAYASTCDHGLFTVERPVSLDHSVPYLHVGKLFYFNGLRPSNFVGVFNQYFMIGDFKMPVK